MQVASIQFTASELTTRGPVSYTHLDVYKRQVKGEWADDEPLLVRVHSSCITGDTFGSLRCECGEQLHKALELIEKEGKGVLLYLHQELSLIHI